MIKLTISALLAAIRYAVIIVCLYFIAPPTNAAAEKPSDIIQAIQVVGNQRIEPETIRAFMLVRPGVPFDQDRLDRSLKRLSDTSLFQNVQLSRQGNVLIVTVSENPLMNKVEFAGNEKLTDGQIRGNIQSRPRTVFTPAIVEADRQKILELYARNGNFNATAEPRIIRQDRNQVDIVFQIADGSTARIAKIAIVGNRAFSEKQLTAVISARESRWWRILSSFDRYEPQRMGYDKELLRRFYLTNGYADVEVLETTAEPTPDRKGVVVTYNLKEGERYRLDTMTITSQIKGVTQGELRKVANLREGSWFDGEAAG